MGFRYGVAEGLRTEAFANQRMGRHIEATRLYLKALPLFEALSDTIGIANTLNGLGIVYFEQADYGNALQYYQRAEPLFLAIGNKQRYAAVLSNIAYTYLEMNYLQLAEIYAEKAFFVATQARAGNLKTYIFTTKADIFRRQNRIDSTFSYLERSREAALNFPSNYFSISRMYAVWGKTLTQQRRFSEAKLYLDSSVFFAERAGMRFRILDAYRGIQALYEAEGDFQQAYKYQSLVLRYNDSLFNQESARQIADMQRELKTKEQNDRISLLVKENELKIVQRNLFIATTILVILAGLGLTLLNRRTRKANKRLERQNEEILQQQRQLSQQSEEIASINAQLQEKNGHLTVLNEEKNHFLAIAAHDLKNPLTGIRSLSDYLAHTTLPESEVKLLGSRISQTAERMFTLVQNLLDINAIESGGFELKMCDLNIVPIAENVVQQYMDAAVEKGITLRFSVVPPSGNTTIQEDDFVIRADENSLFQVFDNIVSNAVKYSPLGKQVFVRLLTNADIVRVEVQDEGQGLNDEDKQHLFGKFTKLSARPTGGEHSTGLGLSIVKQLVEMMNGAIRCESEYLHGATFILEFPRR